MVNGDHRNYEAYDLYSRRDTEENHTAPSNNTPSNLYQSRPKILNGHYEGLCLQFQLWQLNYVNKSRARAEATVLSSADRIINMQNRLCIVHTAIAQIVEPAPTYLPDFFTIAASKVFADIGQILIKDDGVTPLLPSPNTISHGAQSAHQLINTKRSEYVQQLKEPTFSSLSLFFRHDTMTRSDYERYFRDSQFHSPIEIDTLHSSRMGSQTVRLCFLSRQDYEEALRISEMDLMLRDPSIRIVACDVDLRPALRHIPAERSIFVRTQTTIPNLPFTFAQFGPVLSVLSTTNPLSSIIIFSSAGPFSRAMHWHATCFPHCINSGHSLPSSHAHQHRSYPSLG
jgi:hypothetical protein